MGTSKRELEGSVILMEKNLWLTDSNCYKHFIRILKKNNLNNQANLQD